MIQARQREVAFRQRTPLRLSVGREPGNATRFPGSTLSSTSLTLFCGDGLAKGGDDEEEKGES
jgi:hypothetical protein